MSCLLTASKAIFCTNSFWSIYSRSFNFATIRASCVYLLAHNGLSNYCKSAVVYHNNVEHEDQSLEQNKYPLGCSPSRPKAWFITSLGSIIRFFLSKTYPVIVHRIIDVKTNFAYEAKMKYSSLWPDWVKFTQVKCSSVFAPRAQSTHLHWNNMIVNSPT